MQTNKMETKLYQLSPDTQTFHALVIYIIHCHRTLNKIICQSEPLHTIQKPCQSLAETCFEKEGVLKIKKVAMFSSHSAWSNG